MAFKHYDVVRAASPSDLAERLTQKLKEGWQPFGSPVAITPYTLMQAIASEGDVTTPVVTHEDGTVVVSEPEYYFVIPIAGQSNSMAFGEGVPLPETYDRPDPRIKQLARRSTVTPGGASCNYNDIIPADHCLHDVQDMSVTKYNHPQADLSKGQYGCVGQGLHIAKKLLPFIPANAGILLVPCCRGGSGLTTGNEGAFSDATGATAESSLWGVDKPLYKDLLSRTRAALKKNPGNILLCVVWMQGEADLTAQHANHSARFLEMVDKYRANLTDVAGQCVGGRVAGVPWICGDTTYYWKEKYAAPYEAVYGGYKNKTDRNIYFVPLMVDENGKNVPTNEPSEDPDISDAGYFGAQSRTQDNWTTKDRKTHFSSWARRGIIADRMASAILINAGRTLPFITGTEPKRVAKPSQDEPGSISDPSSPGTQPAVPGSEQPSQPATEPEVVTGVQARSVVKYDSTVAVDEKGGNWEEQKWDAKDGVGELITDAGKQVLRLKQDERKQSAWMLSSAISGENARALYENGGEISIEFRLPEDATPVTDDKFLFGVYLPVSGWTQGDNSSNMMASFFTQTKGGNLDIMYHGKAQPNTKIESFGKVDNNWHTLSFKYQGKGEHKIVPVLDNSEKTDSVFSLKESPVIASFEADHIIISGISAISGKTYPVLFRSVEIKINQQTV